MSDEKNVLDDLIEKSAAIEPSEVTSEDLRKINRYALSPLSAEDVFTFKTVIGDNALDDRNGEPFNLAAIKDMARLYPGKTIIKDHQRKADNQVARVYDAEYIVDDSRHTDAGEPYAKVVTKNYMLRTSSNADLIRDIQGGIKREVSTGVRPKHLICNICGSDNITTYCPHYPGRTYDKKDGPTRCTLTIDGVKDAIELSFVAIPSQPRASTTKKIGAPPPAEAEKPAGTAEPETMKDEEIDLRVRVLQSFLFVENHMKGDNHE